MVVLPEGERRTRAPSKPKRRQPTKDEALLICKVLATLSAVTSTVIKVFELFN